MKNILIICCLVITLGACANTHKKSQEKPLLVDMHTSQLALDWQGNYTGIIPCASCEGILQHISLADSTFVLQEKYLGKDEKVYVTKGIFNWLPSGNHLQLLDEDKQVIRKYQVGENKLIQLDIDGKVIQSTLSSQYVLAKTTQNLFNRTYRVDFLKGYEVEKFTRDLPYIFFKEDFSVFGYGACNNFFGSVLIQESSIAFSNIGSTKKYCFETMEIETAFFNALSLAVSYEIDVYDRLYLFDKEHNLLVSFAYTSIYDK